MEQGLYDKTMEYFLFIINIFLIGLLFYKERQQANIFHTILTARLSESADEFYSMTKGAEKEKVEKSKEENEIPLEDLSPEEMLRVLKKE